MSKADFIVISSDEDIPSPPRKKRKYPPSTIPEDSAAYIKTSQSPAARKELRSQSRRLSSQGEENVSERHAVRGSGVVPDLSMLAAGESYANSKSTQNKHTTSSRIRKGTDEVDTSPELQKSGENLPLLVRPAESQKSVISPRASVSVETTLRASADRSKRHNSRPIHPSPAIGAISRSCSKEISQDDAYMTRDSSPEIFQRVSLNELESPASQYFHAIPTIKEVFESCSNEMAQDHAHMVRDLLREARVSRNTLQESLPDFRAEVSPFADMKDISSTSPTSEPFLEVTHIMPKKGQQTKSAIPLKMAQSTTVPVPRYEHYLEIDRNFLVPDITQASFIPYLGDEETEGEWQETFLESYDIKNKAGLRDKELASTIQEYFPGMLDDLRLSLDDVQEAARGEGGSAASVEFCAQFQKYFGINPELLLTTKEQKHSTQTSKSSPEWQKRTESHASEKMLGTYLSECCLICNQTTCGVHGDHTIPMNGGTDKAGAPIVSVYHNAHMGYEDIMEQRNERLGREQFPATRLYSNNEFCSEECFKKPLDEADTPPSTTQWTGEKRLRLYDLVLAMSNNSRAACTIANIFKESCREIYIQIETLPPVNHPISRILKENSSLEWYDQKTKRIVPMSSFELDRITNTHRHADADDSLAGRDTPSPCRHPGQSCDEVGEDCSCKKENVLCERWCECPDDCYLRFQGCDCAQTQRPCQTKSSCACFDLNRECDPALCKSCGAFESADPENRDYKLPTTLCMNTAIQRGVSKATRIGESTVPGQSRMNGLFICEPARKGDFIDEYVGEVISNAEMERRECIATKKCVSYVFGLNAQFNIDSARYGNNLRHVNHSRENPNVEPRILLVDMTHRIGFYASRNLKAGEELFFDYGKHFDANVNGLAEIRKAAPVVKKRRTKQEMIDARENEKKAAGKSAAASSRDMKPVEEDKDEVMPYSSEETDDSDFKGAGISYHGHRERTLLAQRKRRTAAKIKKYTR